tara:strand:- start:220 stop:450 length:231 start_codon:yes stop_codon:yes gene_type:complete
MLNYNTTMTPFDDSDLHDDRELLTIPRIQKWSGSQIYRLLDDIQKQSVMAGQLNIPMEAKNHYRDLFTRLVKTYGH